MSNLDVISKIPLPRGDLILPLSFPQVLSTEFRVHWRGGLGRSAQTGPRWSPGPMNSFFTVTDMQSAYSEFPSRKNSLPRSGDRSLSCKTQNSGLGSKEEKPCNPINQPRRCNTQEGLLTVAQTGDSDLLGGRAHRTAQFAFYRQKPFYQHITYGLQSD